MEVQLTKLAAADIMSVHQSFKRNVSNTLLNLYHVHGRNFMLCVIFNHLINSQMIKLTEMTKENQQPIYTR